MKWDERRVEIINELKEKGIQPYPHKFEFTNTIQELRSIAKEKGNPSSHDPFLYGISTVGRVANIRRHGKAGFVDIFDEGEKLQLYLRVNELGDRYEWFMKYIGRGDIIGVKGDLFYTMKGELSLLVKEFSLLSKALIEPPDWTTLTSELDMPIDTLISSIMIKPETL